jgi:hypothetical protein
LAARQKRPHGVLVYEEIGYVVLQLMPDDGRIERLEIIKKTADALEFQEAAFKRISDAIRRLEDMKKVSSDVKHIWKTKT